MKTVKIEKDGPKSKITRNVLSRIGSSIYLDPHVESVSVRVNFKDGTSLAYRKDEEDDEFKARFRKDAVV
tara:strand:- start:493 stop:702 length:210 start_codon:yes stop_codon:yes gene_type:complete